MENKINRMKELLEIMKKEELAYYLYDCPIVTDREWDAQFDELSALEAETGIVFATSPTQKVGGAVLSGLEKVRHSKPMLSAAKVKNTSEVAAFSAKGNWQLRTQLEAGWFNFGLAIQRWKTGQGYYPWRR